jgi:hypothetical protein
MPSVDGQIFFSKHGTWTAMVPGKKNLEMLLQDCWMMLDVF